MHISKNLFINVLEKIIYLLQDYKIYFISYYLRFSKLNNSSIEIISLLCLNLTEVKRSRISKFKDIS
jgi:hypothetical protein